MQDSVGPAFPNGINVGHIHYNNFDGFMYRYLGGVPTDTLNWVIIGGAGNTDPDTTGWTIQQDGAFWFNKTTNVFRSWDGTQIVTVGSGGGGSSAQRWPWKVIGPEWGSGIAQDAEQDFLIPAAGTITKWAIVIYVAGVNQDINVQLVKDKFNTFDLIDEFLVPQSATLTVVERVVSRGVVLSDMVSIFIPDILNPADPGVKLSGYIDFTPS